MSAPEQQNLLYLQSRERVLRVEAHNYREEIFDLTALRLELHTAGTVLRIDRLQNPLDVGFPRIDGVLAVVLLHDRSCRIGPVRGWETVSRDSAFQATALRQWDRNDDFPQVECLLLQLILDVHAAAAVGLVGPAIN